MHDLRSRSEVDALFAKNGAMQAALEAKADGRIHHIGLTGHHDPKVLLEAMSRHAFDSVLVPINPADARHSPFIPTVVAEARRQGMGVVGNEVVGRRAPAGRRTSRGAAALHRLPGRHRDRRVFSLAEVRQNLAVRDRLHPDVDDERTELEQRVAPRARTYDYYKAGP